MPENNDQIKLIKENINKLEEISNVLVEMNKQSNEQTENQKDQTTLAQNDERIKFQDEQNFDSQFMVMKEQNYILENILKAIEEGESESGDEEKKKGFFGNLLSGLARFLPASFVGLFVPIFKTLFSPKGLLGIGKKLLKFVGAPILAVLAGLDFIEGWKNAEEIVGRNDYAAKYQAGFSQLISGLTLNMIDPKTISQTLDKFNDWMYDNITIPVIDFIKRIPEMVMELPTTIANASKEFLNSDFFQSLLDIPLFKDVIEKTKIVFEALKNKIQTDFIDPIKNILASIIETFDNIVGSVMNFKESIERGVSDKIESVKDFFGFGGDDEIITKDADQNEIRKDMIKSNIKEKTINNTQTKSEATTNNNVVTDNRRTSVFQSGTNMSTRSDDLINQSNAYGF